MLIVTNGDDAIINNDDDANINTDDDNDDNDYEQYDVAATYAACVHLPVKKRSTVLFHIPVFFSESVMFPIPSSKHDTIPEGDKDKIHNTPYTYIVSSNIQLFIIAS